MNITIEKNENTVSLRVTNGAIDCSFREISTDDLILLRDQIDEVLKQPKVAVRVWNPRSQRHDIIEQ